jgi:hypothetical protein
MLSTVQILNGRGKFFDLLIFQQLMFFTTTPFVDSLLSD